MIKNHSSTQSFFILSLLLSLLHAQTHAFVIDSVSEKILNTETFNDNQPLHNRDISENSNLTITRTENINSFNPFLEQNTFSTDHTLCYDSLFMEDVNTYGRVYPLIASKIIPKDDHKTIEIHIHPKATFANQMSIHADDVVASIQHLIKKGPINYHYLASLNLTFTPLESNRFIIQSDKPISLTTLIQIGLLPITQKEDLNNTQTQPQTSGEYHLHSSKKNHFVILKKNQHYWANHLIHRRNMNHFDTIKIIYIRNAMIALETFKKQDADYLWEPIFERWENIKQLTKKKPKLKLKSIPTKRPISMKGFTFNMKNPIFKNKEIRKAFNLAFNFEDINNHLFKHNYTRINSYMTNTPYQQQSNTISFNLEKADDILTEQGWIIEKGKRIHHKSKNPLSIRILVNDHGNEKISNIYSQYLKKLGITTVIQKATQADYTQRIQQGDFDLAYYLINNSKISWEQTMHNFIHHSNHQFGYANLFSLADPNIKKAIQSVNIIKNHTEKKNAIQEIDRYLMEQYYFIPFWYAHEDHIAHWQNIDGPNTPLQINPKDNFKYWWSTSNQNNT
ncbi:MAG: ABC transporter substrate-binding protein [Pseudomonadota bacterium]|nr:ABC transporter substrate-binding protein [Pseudomonadota bacterium]